MLNIPDAIKSLYQQDTTRKNFRVIFPNGELPDITNANILTESVRFTESLCSQQYLRFGLTEASEIQFETIGIPNMMGMTIKCFSEIDTSSLTAAQISAIQAMSDLDGELVLEADSDLTDYYGNKWGFYRVPYGTFTVDSCPRNHGAMTHRKVTAYTVRFTGSDPFSAYDKWYVERLAYSTDKMTVDDGLFYQTLYDTAGADLPNLLTNDGEVTLSYTSTFTDRASFDYDTRPTITVKDASDNDVTLTFVATRTGQSPSESLIPGATSIWITATKGLYYASQSNTRENAADIEAEIAEWLTNKGYNFSESGTTLTEFAAALARHSTTPILESNYGGLVVATNNNVVIGANTLVGKDYFGKYNSDYTLFYVSETGASDHEYMFMLMKDVTGLTVTIDSGGTQTQESIISTTMPISDVNHLYKASVTEPLFPTFSITVDSTSNTDDTYYYYIDAIDFEKILGGALELTAKFGRVDRNGVYQISTLDNSSPIAIGPSMYSELWWDEYDISGVGSIVFTYHDSASDKDETTIYSFGSGESVYEMKDNYLLKHLEDLSASTIQGILDTYFIPNLGTLNFTPIDLDMVGLPYIESSDYLTVTAEDGATVSSYVLRHTISGIQALTDKIESTNGELLGIEEVEL